MKILLIRPKIFESVLQRQLYKLNLSGGIMPNLGQLYIASSLERDGHDVKVIDMYAENLNIEKLVKEIERFNPNLIGITISNNDLYDSVNICNAIKKITNVPIVAGGPHPSIYPREILMHECFDYVVIGEGEITISEFVEKMVDKKQLKNIKGLAYKNNGTIFINPWREPVKELDSIPFPARHLINLKNYSYFLMKRQPIGNMMASRGCPFNCSFCCKPYPEANIARFRSPQNIVDEIEECCNKFKIREIYFYDDTFTLNKKIVFEICDGIKERNLDIIWDVRGRVDCVNKKLLQKMYNAGCRRIYFGVESGDERILGLMNKRTTVKQIKNAFKMANEIGMETLGYFMLGFYGETKESVRNTMNILKQINPTFVLFQIFQPYPASSIYKKMLKENIGDFWSKYTLMEPVEDIQSDIDNWQYKDLSKEEIEKILSKIYKDFYLNPLNIIKIMRLCDSFRRVRNIFAGGLVCAKIITRIE